MNRQPVRTLTLGQVWGASVEARRKFLGMTQVELSSKCEVSQQTISKIEHGSMIPLDRLKVTIAQSLHTTPGELFAWPSDIAPVEVA